MAFVNLQFLTEVSAFGKDRSQLLSISSNTLLHRIPSHREHIEANQGHNEKLLTSASETVQEKE